MQVLEKVTKPSPPTRSQPMSPAIALATMASPALSPQPFSRGLDLEAHQAKARAVFDQKSSVF
ncbi:MAG: hypothetical protein WA885_12605 [Phormidesmis sp.]